MEWQQVLVTLSTLIIVAHGDDSCGSTPKKVTKTVRSHLRDTVHSVWKDDILEEQTKEMQAFFDKKIDEVKETFEDQLSKKDQVIDQNQEKITKLENEVIHSSLDLFSHRINLVKIFCLTKKVLFINNLSFLA